VGADRFRRPEHRDPLNRVAYRESVAMYLASKKIKQHKVRNKSARYRAKLKRKASKRFKRIMVL
jgi:hypothetical protein